MNIIGFIVAVCLILYGTIGLFRLLKIRGMIPLLIVLWVALMSWR